MNEQNSFGPGERAAARPPGLAALWAMPQGTRQHAIQVVNLIAVHGPRSRATLGAELGISRATASRVISDLLDVRVLREEIAPPGARGRPVAALHLDAAAGLAIGVDFGFRNVRTVVSRIDHSVLSSTERTLSPEYGAEEGFATARSLVEDALTESGTGWSDVVGLGAAISGPMDRSTRAVTLGSLLPQWSGDLAEMCARQFPCPVYIGNDAHLAAYAELLWGAGRKFQHFLYVKAHSGTGGSVVLNGALVTGAAGAAGELGHMVVDPSGRICRCGNRGCLETLVSVPSLLSALSPVHRGLTWERAVHLLERGDLPTVRAFEDAFSTIGRASGMLANVLNPEAIIFGGALTRSSPTAAAVIRDGLRQTALPMNHGVHIEIGSLGRSATALGAVALALLRGIAQ